MVETYLNTKALESPKRQKFLSPEFNDNYGDDSVTISPPRYESNKINTNTNTEPNNTANRPIEIDNIQSKFKSRGPEMSTIHKA